MVRLRIFGGLGNQMFQYAYGRSLACRHNTGLLLDYYDQINRTDFDGENLIKITEVFDLSVKLYIGKTRKDLINKYNLKYIDQLISKACLKLNCVVSENENNHPLSKIESCKNIYITGYWQGEQYFADIKDIIRNDFRFKVEKDASSLDIYKQIVETNSVSLHIRGKDYLSRTFYNRCTVEYYLEAIRLISKANSGLKFFIFTDDMDNLRNSYSPLLEFCKVVDYRTGLNRDVVDLLLMSKCRHNVIANSSFSWWGAWLNANPHKIIVSPKKWLNEEWAGNPHYSDESRVPAEWLKI